MIYVDLSVEAFYNSWNTHHITDVQTITELCFLSSITVHSPSNIPAQSPFVKFHQHNTNASHQSCTYSNGKPQTNPNGLQRPHISMTDNQSIQTSNGNSKRKRSWSRAVFSQLQRKGLEIQFQIQKYITKPDRRKLAARLGLTDAQVKVWFQNRRMKVSFAFLNKK